MAEQHVAEYKKRIVADFGKLLKQYPIVGVVNMQSLPAPQLQKMRATLRKEEVKILMGKKRLMTLALKSAVQAKPGIDQLSGRMEGMPAFIFTKENPFKLASTLRKSKSMAPARAGQLAPNDITIPAGPTPFPPGPIISELSQAGLKTGVEGGKVSVKEAKVVARRGEPIPQKIADVLTRLGIEPMEVGLDLVAIFEDGIIYGRDVLSVDDKQYLDNIRTAAAESMALAIGISYYNKETIERFIGKASLEAKAIAEAQNIKLDETVQKVASAEAQAEKVSELVEEKMEKSIDEQSFEDAKKKMELDKKIEKALDKEKQEKARDQKHAKDQKDSEKVEKIYDELLKKGSLRKEDGGN